MRILAGVVMLVVAAACGGNAVTSTPLPTSSAVLISPTPPESRITPEATLGATTTLVATRQPPASTTTAPNVEPPGRTPVPIPPNLMRLRPEDAAPGEEVEVVGSGGHIELRTAEGAVTGYIESATDFTIFFDGQPAGSVNCYINTCKGTLTVPNEAAPGSHEVSVEGGSKLDLTVAGAFLESTTATGEPAKGTSAELVLSTTAFPEAGPIPSKYSCLGEDISPGLSWGVAPEGTETFVVVMDDPDAPGGVWDHWVVFDIPASTAGLDEGQPDTARLPGGTYGKNSWGKAAYGGPCPPPGPAHTYRFFLYAVDISLGLQAGATKDRVLTAIEGHIVAKSMITGTYGR